MSSAKPTAWAVLTAAGSGTRLGANLPKALVEVAGEPMLAHALRGLLSSEAITRVVVTAPAAHLDQFAAVASAACGEAVGTPAQDLPHSRVRVVAGGATRQASVEAGLNELARVADVADQAVQKCGADVGAAGENVGPHQIVLVHDAARCLTPAALIQRVVAAVAAGHPAVVPGLPVTDTIKEVAGGGEVLTVAGTPQRACLRAVQTPQGFNWWQLRRAHAAGQDRSNDEANAASDDAALVEATGEQVAVVEGDPSALKITTPLDLYLAEKLAALKARN
ncbi:MAG: 2-C-methyl-D-erythritol 4-phosphate cytidylyltransferase [Buchananella hordeovulneris]|nr:2-C-methyl-D-erythritol 4-phosphate cytidylyltransferase [Buchananella hordeovulneris]